MAMYSQKTGKSPAFRVSYTKRSDRPIVQHARCDFKFDEDADKSIVWAIWPEFEREPGVPLPEGAEVSETGTATMWIVQDFDSYWEILGDRVHIGATGRIVAGSHVVATATITEVLEIRKPSDR